MLKTKQQRESFAWGVFWFLAANVLTVWIALGNHLSWWYGYVHAWLLIIAACALSTLFAFTVMGISIVVGKWINKGEGFRDEHEEYLVMRDLEQTIKEKSDG